MTTVRIKLLTPTAKAPSYATDGSAGMDLFSDAADFILWPGQQVKIGTGLAMEIPIGFEGQVRPRSGWTDKHGITVANSPGTVDADFRGEVCVMLIHNGNRDITIKRGDRIAQLVISPVERARIEVAAELSDTARGAGGFGSTGR